MEAVTQKTERYRQIIRDLLTKWAEVPNLEDGIRDRTLFDEAHDRYAVISEGWDREERVHFIVADLEIINGKVWILADNTDVVIARQLEEAGIPKSDIVLGFRPPDLRPETRYAVT
ncbi:MAG TPA: XisI protein [Blastocatellia bacterium]|nr:XisI protein [Blastocatellia bacterium]